jgi:hypothetical protein
MQMKRTLLLGLTCAFLHAGTSLGQETKLPPTWAPPPVPVLTQDGGTAPPAGFMDGIGISSRPAGVRVWGDAEFLLWWFKNAPVNTPLVTQATNPADPNSGKIGFADTRILLGDQTYDLGMRYGGRFTLGGWLDSDATIGLEANYLFIAPKSTTQAVGSNGAPGSPVLNFPFFDVNSGKEEAFGLATPTGMNLRILNELQGGELNALGKLIRTDSLNVSGLIGFRYVNFREDLDFAQGFGVPTGFNGSLQDSFHATNNFYGGQLGLRAEYRLGNFFIEATGKVALGSMQQSVNVSGSSTESDPGAGALHNYTNAPGGFYALPTNFGNHTQSVFGVVPEGQFKAGYNITRNIQAYVGYNFLYLNDVARPGASIDHAVNLTQVPSNFGTGFPNTLTGPAAPTFSFNRSDFWAQGVTFGVQFKF